MSFAPREEVEKLLHGLSEAEVRELSVEALRNALAGKRLMGDLFQMHGHLGRGVIPLIAARKNVRLQGEAHVNALAETFIDAMDQPWMSPVFEFMCWFVEAGLAWPLGSPVNGTPITLRLTRRGLRFLELREDHPLLPGFLDRVVARCPGLSAAVTSLLSQSRDCLDHGLVQAALSLMGVAFETAVEEVADVLVARNKLSNVPGKAAARISAVKTEIDKILPDGTPQERDDRFAAHAAYDFAHQLRRRRNDASHTKPKYGFEDSSEAEELLVSAGRHLPNLWRLAL